MKSKPQRLQKAGFRAGSALIMTVVVTVLLAAVGIMFVMSARVDKIATSYITENRELYAAADAVVEEICQQLVEDVPGVGPSAEYFDYPDDADKWLASLEPYKKGINDYRWKQITDLYDNFAGAKDVQVQIIPDGKLIDLFDPDDEYSNLIPIEQLADADGDDVADSKWIRLKDIVTSKGRPIFAAVRVIDNGGMLNVNTGYEFDPNATVPDKIDGSNLMQINLLALSERGTTTNPLGQLDNDRYRRYVSVPQNQDDYIKDVVWRYDEPDGLYTPFDISDELKLRYRYILNYRPINTRIEALWYKAYDWYPFVPRDSNSQLNDPTKWFYYTNNSSPDINDYDYRHISTTYNMDRIITPAGKKMVNINRDDTGSLYKVIKNAISDKDEAAHIAVNLKDFRDSDSQVTLFDPNDPCLPVGKMFYGFERPCVYISELAHQFKTITMPGGIGTIPGIITTTYRSYAIELHKPYLVDSYPESDQWRLSIPRYADSPVSVDWSGSQRFHVIYFEDPCVPLTTSFDSNDYDPNLAGTVQEPNDFNRYSIVFAGGDLIELQRRVGDVNDPNSIRWIVADSVIVPQPDSGSGWLKVDVADSNDILRSVQRDNTLHKCIRRIWASSGDATDKLTLGEDNKYFGRGPRRIQAHPADRDFTNVGEIGMIFRKGAYYEDVADRNSTIGYSSSTDGETNVRVDLTNPAYQNVFQYLTVFDPSRDGINNDGDWVKIGTERIDEDALVETPEWKIPGRININTAPWFVIAQLPWVSKRESGFDRSDLARKIVAHRNNTGSFGSIGELMNVTDSNSYRSIDYYYTDGSDQSGFPDLTPPAGGDGARDDFEERDLIFARISNLVTVRSDVFTAYILVRIGTDGPQKRIIAILDRSGVYPSGGNVRIVAWQPVADPTRQ